MKKNSLSYNSLEEDQSIKKIRDEEEFFDYKETKPREFSDSYIRLSDEILKDKEIIENFTYNREKENVDFIKDSTKIWECLGIYLQDIQRFKTEFVDFEFDGHISKEFCDSLEISSPIDIPIFFTDNPEDAHSLFLRIDMKKRKIIIFRKIFLPRIDNKVNTTVYAHEITHTQLGDVTGGMNEIIHKETIPIFVEQLFADKIDSSKSTLELVRNNRLATVASAINTMKEKKKMSFKQRIDLETYLISVLEGLNLGKVYFNGNESIKKEMITYLNKVFEGELITEDLLDKFNSHFEEIEPDLKQLKKIKVLQ